LLWFPRLASKDAVRFPRWRMGTRERACSRSHAGQRNACTGQVPYGTSGKLGTTKPEREHTPFGSHAGAWEPEREHTPFGSHAGAWEPEKRDKLPKLKALFISCFVHYAERISRNKPRLLLK
jgi:hypothetical protein